MRYRAYKENPNRVKVMPSKIHKLGLFAQQDFKPGDIVTEYVGEIISNKVADQREKNYEKWGIADCYMFRLDENFVIDATQKGNLARFINHSCDENCMAKVESVNANK